MSSRGTRGQAAVQPNPVAHPSRNLGITRGAGPSLPGRHLDPSRSGSAIRHLRHGEIGTSYVHSTAEDLINFWCKDLENGLLEYLMSGFAAPGHICTTASPPISHPAQPRHFQAGSPFRLPRPNLPVGPL